MFSWSSALNNIVKITRHKLFLKPLQWAYSLRDIKNRGLKKSSFFSRMFYKWNTRYFKTYKAIATYTAPKEFSILGFFYFQNPDRLTMIEVIMWLQQHHSFQNKPVRGKKKCRRLDEGGLNIKASSASHQVQHSSSSSSRCLIRLQPSLNRLLELNVPMAAEPLHKNQIINLHYHPAWRNIIETVESWWCKVGSLLLPLDAKNRPPDD